MEDKIKTMKKIIALLFVTFCTFIAFGQKKIITIDFFYEGKKMELKNNFQIFFVINDSSQKLMIKPEMKQNSFAVPNLFGFSKGYLVIKFKKRILHLGFNNFNYTQDMNWKIYLDKKPFDKVPNSNLNLTDAKGIAWISFNPLELGEGVITSVLIRDFKKYYMESTSLIE